jgi:hypothetical protein
MVSLGMLRRVVFVKTDVSEELSASFIRVTRIGELGTTLQEPHGVTSQKTPFFIVTAVKNLKSYLRYSPLLLVRKRTRATERPPPVEQYWCQLLRMKGYRVVSTAEPPRPLIFSFLDRSRYFFFQVAAHLSLQGLSGPRPRPTATQKIC